jgi:vancomycin resistance protein YoaR
MSATAPPTRRFLPRPLLITVAVLAAVLAIYGINRAVSAGKVIGSVTVDGVQLGGITREEALATVAELETTLAESTAVFTVRSSRVQLLPLTAGFRLQGEQIVDEAMLIGRQGAAPAQFWWWLSHLFRTTPIEAQAAIDDDALEQILERWDEEVVGNPPFPGDVAINGNTAEPRYPEAGEQIDREAAPPLMLDQFRTTHREIVDLPVVTVLPDLTAAEIDQAVARARLILAGPVILRDTERGKEMTFTSDQLATALRTQVAATGVTFSFDPDLINGILQPVRQDLEDPPVDARLAIEGNLVSVIPGKRGTVIDAAETAESLLAAAATAGRIGRLPIAEAVDPEVTTAELEALGIKHKVSQFTTYHPCCQNRVTNIHLIANEVDGSIVRPGETFSINQTVGERTLEEGYLLDGTIIGGEIVPTVGGGVSQFATTFYNAVFWGGYEDVDHKPHSFYFSRYPRGIEATISWPVPDLQFRNNTDKAILIKTAYTNTSITVMFFSDNDGRIVSGEQVDGRLRLSVVAEGGPNARIVTAEVSDPENFRDPGPTLFRPDPTVPPGTHKETQSAAQGYTVTVTRNITQQGRTTTDTWRVVYQPRRQIVLVNPCELAQNCPTTTTTTTTTTTIPEETTTSGP